jgi:aspartate kinase
MNNTIVCKFGGTSVANADQIRKVEDIVRQDSRRRYVVVSAPGKSKESQYKVTDLLCNLYANQFGEETFKKRGMDYEKIPLSTDTLARELHKIYSGIASGLGLSTDLVDQFMKELGDRRYQMISPTETDQFDYLISRGENFNARLIAEYLGARFVDALDLISMNPWSRQVFEQNTEDCIQGELGENPPGILVIPGFYGNASDETNQHAAHLLLPRGGSDVTGALIAAGVNANVYENWTDQPGIRCCNPNILSPEQRADIPIIKKMTYEELRELAYRDFKVLNDETIGPVRKKNIPVHVRDTNHPSEPGTIISTEYDAQRTIRGIAGKKGFAALTVEKYLMDKQVGFGRDLLDVFARRGINFEHMPSGVDTLSLILQQRDIAGLEDELKSEIAEKLHPDSMQFLQSPLALIAIVGEGMKHHVGMAAQVTRSLANHGINIETINQGASERSMILGVQEADYKNAIRGLYSDLLEQPKE